MYNMCIYIYIYIYIERERERQRDRYSPVPQHEREPRSLQKRAASARRTSEGSKHGSLDSGLPLVPENRRSEMGTAVRKPRESLNTGDPLASR